MAVSRHRRRLPGAGLLPAGSRPAGRVRAHAAARLLVTLLGLALAVAALPFPVARAATPVVASAGSPRAASPEPTSPEPTSPEDVVRAWVAAVNRADAEAAIALYADDAVIEALGQQFRGKPVIARRQRTIIASVLRPTLTIERLDVAGEAVTVRLVGENAITRFDGRGPVHASTTFHVRDGLIQREVGPVLDPPDAAWYADAFPRFRATGALPALLPNTGDAGPPGAPLGVLAGLLGVALLVAGFVLVRRRQRDASAGRPGASFWTR